MPPTDETRIGVICGDPDDGARNYRVTIAYWDLSRMVLAYTHAMTTQSVGAPARSSVADSSPGLSEHTLIEWADIAIGSVRRSIEPGEQPSASAVWAGPHNFDPTAEAAANDMAEIVRRARQACSPSAPDLAPPALNANFCTYATWSSLTLGRDIRNRLLPYRFDGTGPDNVRLAMTRMVIRARRANGNELARQLGDGQRTVLWEVGLALLWLMRNEQRLNDETGSEDAALHMVLTHDDRCDLDTATDRLVKVIRQGLAPLGIKPLRQPALTEWRPDDLFLGLASYHLARRFALRARAATAVNDVPTARRGWKMVAEMVLRGNLFIGGYEQRRVQNYLLYPVVTFGQRFFVQGEPSPRRAGAGPSMRRRIFAQAATSFEDRLNPLWERFVTDQLLTIQAGDELLRLGRDLPLPPGQPSIFCEDLAALRDSWLINLIRRYDHSLDADGGQGTQAYRWSRFDDRMSFITNFMRSRAQVTGLWRSPFGPETERRIRCDTMHPGDDR